MPASARHAPLSLSHKLCRCINLRDGSLPACLLNCYLYTVHKLQIAHAPLASTLQTMPSKQQISEPIHAISENNPSADVIPLLSIFMTAKLQGCNLFIPLLGSCVRLLDEPRAGQQATRAVDLKQLVSILLVHTSLNQVVHRFRLRQILDVTWLQGH